MIPAEEDLINKCIETGVYSTDNPTGKVIVHNYWENGNYYAFNSASLIESKAMWVSNISDYYPWKNPKFILRRYKSSSDTTYENLLEYDISPGLTYTYSWQISGYVPSLQIVFLTILEYGSGLQFNVCFDIGSYCLSETGSYLHISFCPTWAGTINGKRVFVIPGITAYVKNHPSIEYKHNDLHCPVAIANDLYSFSEISSDFVSNTIKGMINNSDKDEKTCLRLSEFEDDQGNIKFGCKFKGNLIQKGSMAFDPNTGVDWFYALLKDNISLTYQPNQSVNYIDLSGEYYTQRVSVAYSSNDFISITWNANGGTIDGENYKVTHLLKSNPSGSTTINDKGVIPDQRSGYEFTGWYTAANGGNKISNTRPTSDVTYYAHWVSPSGDLGGGDTGLTIVVVGNPNGGNGGNNYPGMNNHNDIYTLKVNNGVSYVDPNDVMNNNGPITGQVIFQ